MFGTARKADAAIRELGREEVTRQYGEYQPLVTSHAVFRAGTPDDGDRPSTQNWSWNKGAIVNTTLTLTSEALLFVAATDSKIAARAGTRIPLADITPSARLVALNPDTGAELWNQPFPATRVTHSLFLSATPDRVIAVGSFTKDIVIEKDDGTESTRLEIWYEVLCLAAKDGTLQWRAEHRNNVPGVGGDHGEQVHHPVIRGDLLFTEPVAYHISTGARWSPAGKDPWYLSGRRGCGTFSASASCLYFRNHNPIALPIEAKATQTKITQVSRPGCWINILPVGGMVLLPEASSGCVCAFPIQTSMGFVPR